MSRWIETEKGWVNLDHVVKAIECEAPDERRGTRYFLRLILAESTEVTRGRYREPPDYSAMFATVIPAQPGQEAVLVRWDVVERPTEVWPQRMPVLGWRIHADGYPDPTPILPENVSPWDDGYVVLLVLPDGHLLGGFDSVEEACRTLLREAQRAWDADHAAKSAAD